MVEKATSNSGSQGNNSDEVIHEDPYLSVKKVKQDLRKQEPPLLDVKVTNPLTYIKSWWKRIIGNEGIEFKIKVRPLTAIAISLIIVSVTLGVGQFVLPFNIPFFQYVPKPTPYQSPEPFRETAFMGTLRYSTPVDRYYLFTGSSEAIILKVPENTALEEIVGSRILAFGNYYENKQTLVVNTIEDLEVLPEEPEPVPTISPEPSPTPEPSSKSTSTPTPDTSPTPIN